MFKHDEILLGKILGIEITLNYSWLLILAIFTVYLALTVFPAVEPTKPAALFFFMGLSGSILIFGSILLHELAHSVVAVRGGLAVKKITLFLFGGASRISEEPGTPQLEIRMALSGPVASLVLGFIFINIGLLVQHYYFNAHLTIALFTLVGLTNITLAIFNLLPGFPLDGGRVLRGILWLRSRDLKKATTQATNGGEIIAYLLIAAGILEIFFISFFGGIWLILIGFFLRQMARWSYTQTLANFALKNMTAMEIARPLVGVENNLSLTDFSEKAMNHEKFFLVQKGGHAIGIISAQILHKVTADEWAIRRVGDKSLPLGSFSRIRSGDAALEALKILQEKPNMPVLVYDQDGPVAIITFDEIAGFLSRPEFKPLNFWQSDG